MNQESYSLYQDRDLRTVIDFPKNCIDKEFSGCDWHGRSAWIPAETIHARFGCKDAETAFLGRKIIINGMEYAIITRIPPAESP